jgi:hypothetical protein
MAVKSIVRLMIRCDDWEAGEDNDRPGIAAERRKLTQGCLY